MKITITHFGEDYAKIEVQRRDKGEIIEYEVPKDIGYQTRIILRGIERIITSQASQAIKVNR